MNKQDGNIFLEISNNTSYNVNKNYFVNLFQKLKRKNLLIHKVKNKFPGNLIVSLVIVNNKEIRSANKKYRNKDETTDVLSFDFLTENKFILPSKKRFLGEILISYSEAIRRSENLKISLKKELTMLFIHGLLHLLGHDHKKVSEKKKMEKLEKLFLKETNVFFESNKNYKKL